MADEEKGYEVIDKRRVKPDDVSAEGETEEAPKEEASPEQPEEKSGEKPSAEDIAAGLPPVDVYTLLGSFVALLGTHAWQWMGLVMNPSTGKIEKDLAQAKVAIDVIAAIAAQLEGKISPSESEQLKAMLSDLRINFVRQS